MYIYVGLDAEYSPGFMLRTFIFYVPCILCDFFSADFSICFYTSYYTLCPQLGRLVIINEAVYKNNPAINPNFMKVVRLSFCWNS